MKRYFIIIFSFMLVVMTTYTYIDSAYLSEKSTTVVKNGEVDLSVTDLSNQLITLNGYWHFYPSELLTPDELHDEYEEIYVPSHWSNPSKSNGMIVGTYHLKVKVAEEMRYGLRFHYIRHASKVFINGEEVGGVGNPTFQKDEYTYAEQKFNVFGDSKDKTLDIVVQVAQSRLSKPGIVKPVTVGTADMINNYTQRSQLIEGAVVATYIAIGFIFLCIMIQRGSITSDLYFALYCLAIGLYTATQSERIILVFLPNTEVRMLWGYQFTSLYLSVLFLLFFLGKAFPQYIHKIVFRTIVAMLSIFMMLLAWPTPIRTSLFNLMIGPLWGIVIIGGLATGFIYVLYILIHVARKERGQGNALLFVFVTIVNYLIALGIEFLFGVDMGNWALISLLITNISLLLLVSERNERGYRKAQELTQQLFVQNELKDELLVKVTTEMSGPLTEIYTESRHLLEGKAGPLKVEQQQLTSSIHTRATKMGHLLQYMYEAAQKNNIHFLVKPISLQSFDELIYEMTFLIKNADVLTIHNEIPCDCPPVLADEKRLRQVLLHIIHNAIKYTEQGSIKIRAYEQGEHICVDIIDTGIGIEEQHLPKIFDTFYQVEQQQITQGVGLGLSIAKQYMHLMNGYISVSSQIGVGTTVTLTLPKAIGKATTVQASQSIVVDQQYIEYPLYIQGNRTETIMVIDQDIQQLFAVTKMLNHHGYNIYAYNSEEDVLNILLNNRVDLVIADISMPNKFILTLTRTMRELYNSVELPIIVLSQNDRIGDMAQLFEEGINDIIRKPVVQSELLSHVSSLLSMREAVQRSIKQELSYYHAQITPHFLYNTLNSIIALSYLDQAKMREALEHLAIYFRAKLDYQKQLSIVPIEEELELIEAYLAIEQLRFNHLQVVMEIDESVSFEIPVMTLQPLVENAIHHGLKNKHEQAKLNISLTRDGDTVKIIIADNGAGMSSKKQTQLLNGHSQRLGFLNPFEKLKLLKHSTFQLESKEGEGTTITITLKWQEKIIHSS